MEKKFIRPIGEDYHNEGYSCTCTTCGFPALHYDHGGSHYCDQCAGKGPATVPQMLQEAMHLIYVASSVGTSQNDILDAVMSILETHPELPNVGEVGFKYPPSFPDHAKHQSYRRKIFDHDCWESIDEDGGCFVCEGAHAS